MAREDEAVGSVVERKVVGGRPAPDMTRSGAAYAVAIGDSRPSPLRAVDSAVGHGVGEGDLVNDERQSLTPPKRPWNVGRRAIPGCGWLDLDQGPPSRGRHRSAIGAEGQPRVATNSSSVGNRPVAFLE